MKNRFFRCNKLVRSKISEKFSDGLICHRRIMEDNEYLIELNKKMQEEWKEVLDSKNNEERVSELADLFEVLLAYANFFKINLNEIKEKATLKLKDRGNFDEKIYCEYFEIYKEKCEVLNYILENKEKYPEFEK